jgi:hypothetical protein
VGAKQTVLLSVTYLCSALLLVGCTNFKRDLGLAPAAPDEFAVESRAPLTIPPDFDLRPPQPGAPRPQEASAAEKARKAIENAGPGEPGKQAAEGIRAPQTGLGNSERDLGDNSLSNKLLGFQDNGGGAAVERRETTVMKDVY